MSNLLISDAICMLLSLLIWWHASDIIGSKLRRVFYFYFYEILVDSTLATRRIGELKFSCLQFVSSAHNVASEVMETLLYFCTNSVLIWMTLQLYFNLTLVEIKLKDMPHVCLYRWQGAVATKLLLILRASCLVLYRRILAISRVAKK